MGERFAGRYELVDHLGEGGAGSVWRAWDGRREQYVAAKLLRQRDAGALLRFVREQSLRVAHPHVVAPTGWAAEDDDVLLTMDLVRGGSVATLLGDYQRLPPATVATLVDQLLDALAAVHAAGLVHRDVKPANLLLEPTGTGPPFLRLADFGIAVLRSDPRLTATGYVMGTAGYVAPEVMLGAEPDPRQDLWSVGVVGLLMLSGRRPGQGLAETAGACPALADWLRTLTRPDADRRCGDAGTARAQLRGIDVPPPDDREPVEVFDHLAALPPGWTPQGPLAPSGGSVRRWQDRSPAPEQPGAPETTGSGRTEEAAAPATSPIGWRAPGAVGPLDVPPATRALTGDVPPLAGGVRDPAGGPARRAGLRTGLVLRLLAVVGLVVLAGLAFHRALSSAGEQPLPAPAGLPQTDAQPGDPCPFTDVGVSRSADGRLLTCRLQGGGYRWMQG